MKITTGLFFLLVLVATKLSGQTSNTVKLFRNLPLDKSVTELNTILHNDSTNYKQHLDKNGQPYYIAITKIDTFFYLTPLVINFQTHGAEIHFNITADKKNKLENGRLTYNSIIDLVKDEYAGYRQSVYKHKYKRKTYYDYTTEFFNKKEDGRAKLKILWYPHSNGHEIIIIYTLD
jgi:hypothetical protein